MKNYRIIEVTDEAWPFRIQKLTFGLWWRTFRFANVGLGGFSSKEDAIEDIKRRNTQYIYRPTKIIKYISI